MSDVYGLYLITDRQSLRGLSLEEVVDCALAHGVSCVQLREKGTGTREFVELARALQPILCKYKVPLFINDRIDVALAVGADGVHVGQSDMAYEDLVRLVPSSMSIGMTINHLDQLTAVNAMNLKYLGVSAVFESKVKQDLEHIWTPNEISVLRQKSRFPLIAIGGVNLNNASLLLRQGFDGIAVCSAICGQDSLEKVGQSAQELSEIMRGGSSTML